MSRPYPVPIQNTTIYTESRGNIEVNTAELRYDNGTIEFETTLFWDIDESNPNDMGSVKVASTENKDEAYQNHSRWSYMYSAEAKIQQAITEMENRK